MIDSRRKKEYKKAGNIKSRSKVNIKEKVTEILELPKEIVLNIPRIIMIGKSDILVENYKGIIEYEITRVRINTEIGIIKITGNDLVIGQLTSENIMITGDIISLEFGGV